jgi:hypothetical protein
MCETSSTASRRAASVISATNANFLMISSLKPKPVKVFHPDSPITTLPMDLRVPKRFETQIFSPLCVFRYVLTDSAHTSGLRVECVRCLCGGGERRWLGGNAP